MDFSHAALPVLSLLFTDRDITRWCYEKEGENMPDARPEKESGTKSANTNTSTDVFSLDQFLFYPGPLLFSLPLY